ncbi:MAG: DUF2846 domain-containing protein [Cytophagales bacterium]|nr:MAG: DUF2846 domain-containing protein [Cytophagales bacterium]
MKPLLFALCLLTTTTTYAQLLAPDPQKATLVFFREFPSRFGHECWSCNYRITVNKHRICNLSENRFVVYTTDPGTTLVMSRPARSLFAARAKSRLVLQTEANKIYYIRCDQNTAGSLGRGALVMRLNDVAQAMPTLAGMKPDACMRE